MGEFSTGLDIFEVRLREKMTYKKSNAKLIRYFLCTIDQHFRSLQRTDSPPVPDRSYVYDLESIDIEHIYPQNPVSRDAEADEVVHTLGNLSFWAPGENRSANNSDFAIKREAYARSMVWLNREVSEHTSWTARDIENRSRQLVERALRVYTV